MGAETDRILEEYRRRDARIDPRLYSLTYLPHLYLVQQRTRDAIEFFGREGLLPLGNKRILETGCGNRGWLIDFESWGAVRSNLAGVELRSESAAEARQLLGAQFDENRQPVSPGAAILCRDASELPWPSGFFNIVLQSMMFSSILDKEVRSKCAKEMVRVLSEDGAIIWYDFFYNPRNKNVHAIRKSEIYDLFPNCEIKLKRITLAPPLARLIVPRSWLLAMVLEKTRAFNSHYLAVIRKKTG